MEEKSTGKVKPISGYAWVNANSVNEYLGKYMPV